MNDEQIDKLIREKYALYQRLIMQAQIVLAQLQGIAEAEDLSADQVNKIIGASLFSDEKPDIK